MLKPLSLLIAASFAITVPAQTLTQYLHLRSHYGIKAAVGVPALDTLVGSRVVEVAGTVKGAFQTQSSHKLMVERLDGDTDIIDAKFVPSWLEGNEIPARLIIKASRSGPNEPLVAELLAAAPESSIAEVEHREQEQELAQQKQLKSKPLTQRQIRSGRHWSLPASKVTPIYAAYILKQNPRLGSAKAMNIAQAIVGFSFEYGVDARLIIAMVMVESGFDPSSRSHSGAMGLGQLMPGTAKWMGVSNAYDTTENLYGTVKLLRTHIDQYKKQTGQDYASIVLALAAYNAGEGAVSRHGGVPPYRETQAYIKRVIGYYNSYRGL